MRKINLPDKHTDKDVEYMIMKWLRMNIDKHSGRTKKLLKMQLDAIDLDSRLCEHDHHDASIDT